MHVKSMGLAVRAAGFLCVFCGAVGLCEGVDSGPGPPGRSRPKKAQREERSLEEPGQARRPGTAPDDKDAVLALLKLGARLSWDETGPVRGVALRGTRETPAGDDTLAHLKALPDCVVRR